MHVVYRSFKVEWVLVDLSSSQWPIEQRRVLSFLIQYLNIPLFIISYGFYSTHFLSSLLSLSLFIGRCMSVLLLLRVKIATTFGDHCVYLWISSLVSISTLKFELECTSWWFIVFAWLARRDLWGEWGGGRGEEHISIFPFISAIHLFFLLI